MRAAQVRAPGSSPSHLAPHARIPGLVWARRAPLMLMMRAPAVRIMRSRPRAEVAPECFDQAAEAASSNLLALHRAVQKPAPTPHGTRARAFRSHSPADFEFPRPCRRPRRGAHHEHQRDPRGAAKEGRRLVPASLLKGFAFTASPSSGGPRPRPQKGHAALPDFQPLPQGSWTHVCAVDGFTH